MILFPAGAGDDWPWTDIVLALPGAIWDRLRSQCKQSRGACSWICTCFPTDFLAMGGGVGLAI